VAEATAEARAAFAYYDQTGFTAQRARALTLLARAEERLGNLAAAQTSYEALLKSAIAVGSQRQIAEQHDSLCRVLLQRELYVEAVRHGDESLTRFRSLKAPYDIAHGTLLHADLLRRTGRLDDAERELDAMFSRDSGMGASTSGLERSRALGRARVLLARNENARAAAIARRALAAQPTELSASMRAELQRVVVLALARGGQAAKAVSLMEAASTAAAESADRNAIAQAALAKAEVLLRLRRYDEALTVAGPLADQLANDGRHESAWLAARLAAQAATALGRTDAMARWQALADAERTRFVAQFDAAGLRLYESRPDLKPWL
jgi:tetratricopeptide (TPR) repeat protein